MEGALVVAIVAVVIAGLSFALSIVALIYTHRTDQRDKARFANEKSAADAAKRAELVVIPAGGRAGVRAESRDFHFNVRNRGPAAATSIRLWLEAADGAAVSSTDPYPLLVEGESTKGPVSMYVRSRRDDYPLALWVEWTDDAGTHRRSDADVG